MPVEPVYSDSLVRCFRERNVVVAVWLDVPTLVQTGEVGEVLDGVAEAYPGRYAVVNVAVSGTPRFPAPIRDEIVRLFKRNDHVLASAQLILLEGLVGAAVRAFFQTVLVLVRPRSPSKVFGRTPDAIEWMLPRLAVDGAPEWRREELEALLRAAARRP